MKLQTKISLNKEKNQIDYDSKVLLLGSCFAENIGAKFDFYKFKNLQNPFGIIFHPVGIEKLIDRAISGKEFEKSDLFFHNSLWLTFEVHSKLSRPEQDELRSLLNDKLSDLKEYLTTATHVIITLGTAWVYEHRSSNTIVSNCHKIPQKEFLKKLLSVGQVNDSMNRIVTKIQSVNPNATIISTISPVRHLRDGFVDNTRSKAHLFAGLHQCVDRHDCVFYFPAYELMFDELRDYRFYMEDMIHPNKTAIEIIWERFRDTWIASETIEIQKEIEDLQKMRQHKPFNPSSEAYREFNKTLDSRLERLQKKYPFLDP